MVAGLLTMVALSADGEAWGQKAVPVTSVRVRDERWPPLSQLMDGGRERASCCLPPLGLILEAMLQLDTWKALS